MQYVFEVSDRLDAVGRLIIAQKRYGVKPRLAETGALADVRTTSLDNGFSGVKTADTQPTQSSRG